MAKEAEKKEAPKEEEKPKEVVNLTFETLKVMVGEERAKVMLGLA